MPCSEVMKIHEGAGLGAAVGGRHDRRVTADESAGWKKTSGVFLEATEQKDTRRLFLPGGAFVWGHPPIAQPGEPGSQPCVCLPASWILMLFMVKNQKIVLFCTTWETMRRILDAHEVAHVPNRR